MRPATTALAGVWLDHDSEVRQLNGMLLAESAYADGDLVSHGARLVALADVIDVADADAAVQALTLVRNLTSHGVAVDWRIDLGAAQFDWDVLNHLYPPTELIGVDRADELLGLWRSKYYFCKCIYRTGPGFLQIRDRRRENLARFTIDDPRYMQVIDQMTDGVPAKDVPADVARALLAERLAIPVGELVWLAPYRVRRWPVPSPVV
ncbi:hypothetical protein E1263_19650 [Kribbella antibiotica]|uniref:Uncharacterized protein n=1 Tax=Kribbella antibiotica TaxID=190195 RepID=A0A4V2YPK1_9ACTN|nr:DUF5825 family protein [Kribbella antibiotica]TDD58337.1 hypothetical protein E1263_19650 [Kribbella antibiotica]